MSCRTPNWRGPIPEPTTSVRSPQTAPEPKLNCMSNTPSQETLQRLLCGVSDVPSLRVTGDGRAREMVAPPALNELFQRIGSAGSVSVVVFFGHWPLLGSKSHRRKF